MDLSSDSYILLFFLLRNDVMNPCRTLLYHFEIGEAGDSQLADTDRIAANNPGAKGPLWQSCINK